MCVSLLTISNLHLEPDLVLWAGSKYRSLAGTLLCDDSYRHRSASYSLYLEQDGVHPFLIPHHPQCTFFFFFFTIHLYSLCRCWQLSFAKHNIESTQMVILYSFFIPVCWANLCLEYLWMSQCLFPERITHLILSMFFFPLCGRGLHCQECGWELEVVIVFNESHGTLRHVIGQGVLAWCSWLCVYIVLCIRLFLYWAIELFVCYFSINIYFSLLVLISIFTVNHCSHAMSG